MALNNPIRKSYVFHISYHFPSSPSSVMNFIGVRTLTTRDILTEETFMKHYLKPEKLKSFELKNNGVLEIRVDWVRALDNPLNAKRIANAFCRYHKVDKRSDYLNKSIPKVYDSSLSEKRKEGISTHMTEAWEKDSSRWNRRKGWTRDEENRNRISEGMKKHWKEKQMKKNEEMKARGRDVFRLMEEENEELQKKIESLEKENSYLKGI